MIKLFLSLIFLNLSSSLLCMTGMIQRTRLALPSALFVARMPKPQLMQQRNFIRRIEVDGSGFHHRYSLKALTFLSKLVSASEEIAKPSTINTAHVYAIDQFPTTYFAQVSIPKDQDQYFVVENKQDAETIASMPARLKTGGFKGGFAFKYILLNHAEGAFKFHRPPDNVAEGIPAARVSEDMTVRWFRYLEQFDGNYKYYERDLGAEGTMTIETNEGRITEKLFAKAENGQWILRSEWNYSYK